ncbi:MAG TPA: oxidoreductase, partial [Planctomycetota bacterium]|nr:oxidoreductase [Planctomycetota bacterium]
MKTWHMVIDVARCHDCNDCFLADRDEFVDNDFPPTAVSQPAHGHRWLDIKRREGGQFPIVRVSYLPMPCMHCDEAPCLTADG